MPMDRKLLFPMGTFPVRLKSEHVQKINQLKTRSFNLVSGSTDNFFWRIVAKIKENGTFATKGTIAFFNSKETNKLRFERHRDELLARAKSWRLENLEKYNAGIERWRHLNPDRWAKIRKMHTRKQRHKRRGLGFVPLNEPFDGAHCHHIDFEHVIYIPAKLHRSIYHNVFTGEGMEEINREALFWSGLEILSGEIKNG